MLTHKLPAPEVTVANTSCLNPCDNPNTHLRFFCWTVILRIPAAVTISREASAAWLAASISFPYTHWLVQLLWAWHWTKTDEHQYVYIYSHNHQAALIFSHLECDKNLHLWCLQSDSIYTAYVLLIYMNISAGSIGRLSEFIWKLVSVAYGHYLACLLFLRVSSKKNKP